MVIQHLYCIFSIYFRLILTTTQTLIFECNFMIPFLWQKKIKYKKKINYFTTTSPIKSTSITFQKLIFFLKFVQ